MARPLLSVTVLALVLLLAASCGGSKKKTNTSALLIHINLKGQPTPKIHTGQKVGIIGQLTANPPDAAKQLGVTNSADKRMLGRQGAYLVVSIGDLKLG